MGALFVFLVMGGAPVISCAGDKPFTGEVGLPAAQRLDGGVWQSDDGAARWTLDGVWLHSNEQPTVYEPVADVLPPVYGVAAGQTGWVLYDCAHDPSLEGGQPAARVSLVDPLTRRLRLIERDGSGWVTACGEATCVRFSYPVTRVVAAGNILRSFGSYDEDEWIPESASFSPDERFVVLGFPRFIAIAETRGKSLVLTDGVRVKRGTTLSALARGFPSVPGDGSTQWKLHWTTRGKKWVLEVSGEREQRSGSRLTLDPQTGRTL